MSTYTAESDTSDQLVVTVEQADALLEMIASDENAGRISSAALTSGLVAQGLASANGLAGDAARILEPVHAAHTRICIRVVSPSMRGIVRDWKIWPTAPRSVIMRSDVDGVHFSQVDYCEVPHILAFASLLHAGPTTHDGPPYIPADFVAAIRSLDAQRAQDVLNNLVTYGRANPRAARRGGSRPFVSRSNTGRATSRSDLGDADGATHALDLPVARRLAAVNTAGLHHEPDSPSDHRPVLRAHPPSGPGRGRGRHQRRRVSQPS